MKLSASVVAIWLVSQQVEAFVAGPSVPKTTTTSSKAKLIKVMIPTFHTQQHQQQPMTKINTSLLRMAQIDDNDDKDNDETSEKSTTNPYADPNYPDLEFINYDDPEYQVDQGVSDEFFDSSSLSSGGSSNDTTEQEIEAMREDRRKRNDEFQFETYYAEVLKKGKEYMGEWTVYKTSTFLRNMEHDPSGIPRLALATKPLRVITSSERIEGNLDDSNDAAAKLAAVRIKHVERLSTESETPKSEEEIAAESEIMKNMYWPELLSVSDFRGHQGTMVVGNGYTICTSVPLIEKDNTDDDDDDDYSPSQHEGPFAEYRAEVGIQKDLLRFRVKFDYSVLDEDMVAYPPLHLKTVIVCRETLEMWPRSDKYKSKAEGLTADALFGEPGADGGLYDPPPVGSDEQASQYMMLNLDGRATVLFPYIIDQDPKAHDGNGWVTSLDWTPDDMRFQVDRKIGSGKGLKGLRTLELSEVQSANANTYRPRDGGKDMRQ